LRVNRDQMFRITLDGGEIVSVDRAPSS